MVDLLKGHRRTNGDMVLVEPSQFRKSIRFIITGEGCVRNVLFDVGKSSVSQVTVLGVPRAVQDHISSFESNSLRVRFGRLRAPIVHECHARPMIFHGRKKSLHLTVHSVGADIHDSPPHAAATSWKSSP